MVRKPESDTEQQERRIDLSLPQVAGSAVAAVAAAVAASQLGVYGTIAGAGVMSIVATCGGSVFQHFFRRTGEQIREVTVQVKHPGREVTVHTRETGARRPDDAAHRAPAGITALLGPVDDPTTVLRRTDTAADLDATTVLRHVDAEADRTTVLRRPAVAPGPDEEFSAATTHGTRLRGWKRSAIGAAAVFVVSMAGITTYELISGGDLSGGRGTTVGSVVRGERDAGPSTPAPADEDTEPGRDTTDRAPDDRGTPTPGTGDRDAGSTAPQPDRGGAPTDAAKPTPTPTPTGPAGGAVEPAPTPSPGATDNGGESPATDPATPDGAPAPAGPETAQ
ncbi:MULTISPECIES: hypothetical protein [unclassified Streptomyces]|uniref:hypothetical protein n=1 Tax=unclassified Streptomyces TaxID=2593676 RepID=UPI000DABC4EB|nr:MULTISPECIES: hypothetical protein [unclassified Streptomyces]PZT77145.1 hypothetical protein DNK56_28395 [Streptomyces sp. AC1-42W]PZT78903.1 hypothetical protein DNK55_04285 [Streptomyces sp. AC1-42T]